jgi:transposase
MEFMRDFPDDATCLEWLWRTRHSDDGEHAFCERCATVRVFKRYQTGQRRQSWTCTGCGDHVHPTAGTIFHKSSTSLHLWFYAIYLMTSTRCGISAKQLERELGVTYKTAWRVFHLIRNELMTDDNRPLSGTVEMDEMYVGGKPRQSDRAKWSDLPTQAERRRAAQQWSDTRKTPVFGMVERGGDVAPTSCRALVRPPSVGTSKNACCPPR